MNLADRQQRMKQREQGRQRAIVLASIAHAREVGGHATKPEPHDGPHFTRAIPCDPAGRMYREESPHALLSTWPLVEDALWRWFPHAKRKDPLACRV
jgi:hypothetical protein